MIWNRWDENSLGKQMTQGSLAKSVLSFLQIYKKTVDEVTQRAYNPQNTYSHFPQMFSG